jgi:hypothetical protein
VTVLIHSFMVSGEIQWSFIGNESCQCGVWDCVCVNDQVLMWWFLCWHVTLMQSCSSSQPGPHEEHSVGNPDSCCFLTRRRLTFRQICVRGCDLSLSGVWIAINYGLDGRGVEPRFFSLQCPDRFWGPPGLLCNGYRGSFSWSKAVGAWSWPLTSN